MSKDPHDPLNSQRPLHLATADGSSVMLTPTTPLATTVGYNQRLQWMVRYSDDNSLYQFDADGTERPIKDIAREKLRSFIMLDNDDKRVVFVLEFKPGYEFIYRRRTALRNGHVAEVIHVVGWRKKIQTSEKDEYISNINFIYESDLHIESGEFLFEETEGYGSPEQWRYAPEFIDDDYIVVE